MCQRLCISLSIFALIAGAQTFSRRLQPAPPTEQAAFAKSRKVAIVVGVGKYPRASGIGSLTFPPNDADALEAVLTAQGYSVSKLVDGEATREAIRKTLRDAAEIMEGRDGTLIFHFSGHGWAPDGKTNTLATYDAGIENLTGSGLRVDEVVALMEATKAQRRVVWIDACRDEPGKSVSGRAFAQYGRAEGTRILYSTKAGRKSYENAALGKGVFTHFLVEALQGAARGEDGAVTFRDVTDYVVTKVSDWGFQRGELQVPYEAGEASGDFLLGRVAVSVSPVPPPSEVVKVDPKPETSELADWLTAKDSDALSLRLFLGKHPNGRFAEQARLRLTTMELAATLPGEGPNQPKINPKDGLPYVYIPAGTFRMGCSPGDNECDKSDEIPAKQVTLTKGFWLGQTEVTQVAYEKVIGANPSNFKGATRPVETVDWNQASQYCQTIGGRLPTEAEWEWAARGGTTSAHYGDVAQIGWYGENSDNQTHPVGEKSANAYGLKDMLGNVREWTGDWYQKAIPGGQDPTGPSSGTYRVLRGGSWIYNSSYLRASYRDSNLPSSRYYLIGFRCLWER